MRAHSAGAPFPDSRPLAILTVLTEAEALLRRAAIIATEAAGGWTFWRARMGGRDIIIVGCGMGKVNAAMAVQSAIERYMPAALIVCGSAGSLSDEVLPGDLVVADRAAQHDVGVNLGRRFTHMGVQVQRNGQGRLQRAFPADSSLVAAAAAAGRQLPYDGNGRPAQVHVGPIASGDQIVFSYERKTWIRETWHALAVEMEGAAAAQVAQANGIPWVVIRGISDTADAGINLSRLAGYVEDGESVKGWALLQSRRLSYLARHPNLPAKLQQLRKGIRLAAGRAAALTEATIAAWAADGPR